MVASEVLRSCGLSGSSSSSKFNFSNFGSPVLNFTSNPKNPPIHSQPPPTNESNLEDLLDKVKGLEDRFKANKIEIEGLDEELAISQRKRRCLLKYGSSESNKDNYELGILGEREALVGEVGELRGRVRRCERLMGEVGVRWKEEEELSTITSVNFDLLISRTRVLNHRMRSHGLGVERISDNKVKFSTSSSHKILVTLFKNGLGFSHKPFLPFFQPNNENQTPSTGFQAYQDLVDGYLPSIIRDEEMVDEIEMVDRREEEYLPTSSISSSTISDLSFINQYHHPTREEIMSRIPERKVLEGGEMVNIRESILSRLQPNTVNQQEDQGENLDEKRAKIQMAIDQRLRQEILQHHEEDEENDISPPPYPVKNPQREGLKNEEEDQICLMISCQDPPFKIKLHISPNQSVSTLNSMLDLKLSQTNLHLDGGRNWRLRLPLGLSLRHVELTDKDERILKHLGISENIKLHLEPF